MDNIFLKAFHIAGFSHYQGAYVFSELTIGTKIKIVLDEGNIHDDHAVELRYNDHKIGYIPISANHDIAIILKAGHDIFEAVIQQLSPHEHPEHQVRVGLFVKANRIRKEDQ
ncbi:MAG: HIRAN domain-containing protein [Desulfobacteraceae bacterium]